MSVPRLAMGYLLALVPLAACAGPPRAPLPAVNVHDGIALRGYDPVAYFTEGRPLRGSEAHAVRHQGALYRFASAEHQALFETDPERYRPRYGGYCAYAVAVNRVADADPERWSILDGRLYLNANRLAELLWSLDARGRVETADRHWKAFPKAALSGAGAW